MSISYGGVTIKKGSESLLVVEVKEKQHHDPILVQLKGATHSRDLRFSPKGEIADFSTRVDCVFLMWAS